MIEIDFIPVGEETNTGDAILSHFIDPETGATRVVLIDGGFRDTATQIASHVQEYYGTDFIDLAVCTHPDDDHINGLFGVIEKLTVGRLLIHQPSSYGYTSDDVKADQVDELIKLARESGTEVITTAFAGTTFFGGSLAVAGPTEGYYQELLGGQEEEVSRSGKFSSAFRTAVKTLIKALAPRATDPGEGELTDNGGTTSRNNTSIILDLRIDGYRALFTGDAGAPALTKAADHLDASGLSATLPDFFDVPHHGSRHNLTTDVMNRLAGPVTGDTSERTAFVSVGKKADDFPRPEVANAFKRRGYSLSPTRGRLIGWSRNAEPRPGWTSLSALPWVELEE